MSIFIELDMSDALVTADVDLVDASFGHEFGTHKCHSFEVRNLKVTVEVGNKLVDITSLLDKEYLQELEEEVIEEASTYPTEDFYPEKDYEDDIA